MQHNEDSMPNSALIAMSGGVDSTVAAWLTLDLGIDCTGAIMKLYSGNGSVITDAKAAAEQLRIPLHIFDFSEHFSKKVITRFIETYLEGRTPNPCIDCNKYLKFGLFLDKARELGKDCVVTGHYARIERGADNRYILKKGRDPEKDQSYVLYHMTQEQLARTRFPLGTLTKPEVREIAAKAGFGNAQKGESQDICFIPGGKYAQFIQEHTQKMSGTGRFIDTEGNYLGRSKGVEHYTIGQRHGLALAMPYPVYVLEIRPETNTVVVGKNELLFSKTLLVRDINLIAPEKLNEPIRANVKIRYKHTGQPAVVRQIDNDTLQVEFDEPQRAITKGQAAVIYDGDVVIGGGTIV